MNPLDLVELLKNHTVYIQTHNFPDPDAISSAFALQEFLAYYGIQSRLCYDGRIDRLNSMKMLDSFGISMCSSQEIQEMKEDDYIVLVDSQKLNSNVTDFIGNEVACIDHHPTFFDYTYQYSDIQRVGACASIIASYYQQTNTPISQNAASALAYGIKMDTADFTRGTQKLDIDMFSYLYEYADWDLVNHMYSNTMVFDDLRAYGAAIQNIKVYDYVGFASIPFNCTPALIAIISDFILSLDVVDVAIVYAHNTDGIRLSVRSERNEIHAGELISLALKDFGSGGGHPTMAGGMIPQVKVEAIGTGLPVKIHHLFLEALDMLLHK